MEAFKKESIVSEIIDEIPKTCLKVQYGDATLNPGDILTPTQVKDRPVISFDAKDDEFFTLVMNDPDAPSRQNPEFGEISHWLVTNIPGSDVSKGEEMTEYIGSGAPKGTGLHRYILLLYKQSSGKMDFSALPTVTKTTLEGRRKHKVRDFAEQHKLQLVAGNFFLAEYDDYVPILHAQFGLKPPQK